MIRSKCNVIVALCASAIILSCSRQPPGMAISGIELSPAMPPFELIDCRAPNSNERQAFELAASVVELGHDDHGNANWLEIGAQKFLSTPRFTGPLDKRVLLCTPADILERVSSALAKNGFGVGRLVEYQLELAFRLPHPSPEIVEAVANSAFNADIQFSETFQNRDLRPYARTVLASFGELAKPYAKLAYERMSADDSMGTGAAQVAAAGGYPEALPRIEALMEKMVSAKPANKAIPWAMKQRLRELTLAIYYAGERGKKYTKPIHQIMERKVQSWAPPFGMVEINPKSFCGLLERIEGIKSVQKYQYCADVKIPMDQ